MYQLILFFLVAVKKFGNRGRAVIQCVRTMKNSRPQNRLGTVTIKWH